jgi:outer membrane protein assembly factor BamB
MGRWKRLLTLGGVVVAVVGLSGCWPAPGAGPDRQSFNGLETRINVDNVDTFARSWTASDLGGNPSPGSGNGPIPAPVGTPVVSPRGVVYVSTDASLHAFDPATGSPRWYQNLWGGEIDTSALVLDDDRVVVASGRSLRSGITLLAFDGATGQSSFPRPQASLADSARGDWLASSIGREGMPAFTFHTGIRVVNVHDPAQAWEGWIDDDAGGVFEKSLTVAADRVLQAGQGLASAAPGTGTFGNGVRSFPITGGTSNCGPAAQPAYACPQWVTPIDGDHATPPVLSTDQATTYTVSDIGTVYAIDTATGAIEWSTSLVSEALGGVLLPPALAYGTLFVPTTSGRLLAVDAADGSFEWGTPAISEITVQPAVAGGVVFIGTAAGDVMAFDAHGCGRSSCPPLWSDNLDTRITGSPAISHGKVFVGTLDGRLVAYGPTG